VVGKWRRSAYRDIYKGNAESGGSRPENEQNEGIVMENKEVSKRTMEDVIGQLIRVAYRGTVAGTNVEYTVFRFKLPRSPHLHEVTVRRGHIGRLWRISYDAPGRSPKVIGYTRGRKAAEERAARYVAKKIVD